MEKLAVAFMLFWFAFIAFLYVGAGYLIYRVLEHQNWI